jgi:hypothetical protein
MRVPEAGSVNAARGPPVATIDETPRSTNFATAVGWMGQWGGWKNGVFSAYIATGTWGGLSPQLKGPLDVTEKGFCGRGGTGEERSVALVWL